MAGALVGLALLLIGDSHLSFPDSLLKSLPEALAAEGATVTTYGVCASQSADWVTGRTSSGCGANIRHGTERIRPATTGPAPTPVLSTLIRETRPDAVVIVLGDTLAAYGQDSFPADWVRQQIAPLTADLAAAGTPCFWVGPAWGTETPRYRKTDDRARAMADLLQATIWPCLFVDSLKMSAPGDWPTRDGMHLTASSYARWGREIAGSLVLGLSAVPRREGEEGTLQKAP